MSERCIHTEPETGRNRFRIECPDCGALFLVSTPEALVWERCPSCQTHVWDLHDVRMADRVSANGRCATDADAAANN